MGSKFSIVKFELKKRPGFYLLLLILITIIAVTIKPNFYLLGWDNYSSYFNLPNNLFQTFFATWREYRGLGVPSDSEVTDLFRQIIYLILHIFTPEKLLDQIYNCMALFLGGLSMYFLASQLCRKIFKDKPQIEYADWFGFFAAFFYLFNLNTLATFYFPMIMYVNRFFMLPLVFFSILLLVQGKTSRKLYLFTILVFLFCSGSFLTATIFIVLLMGLFLYGLCSENYKKYFLVLILFVVTQAFWLFPFFNYTLQKSKIIPLAPAFVSTNEVQLNKAQKYYSLDKTLTFYPSFFDTQFSDIQHSRELYFHPLANLFNNPIVKIILLIFPLLYILGSGLILVRYKTFKSILWVPATIILFTFLTLKEFSPLGFLYNLLDSHVPYFGILFRFGDTKFHPMIVFAGSIAAALFLIESYHFFRERMKYLVSIIIAIVLILTFGVFSYYIRGGLISPYKYVTLPDAYKNIATRINSDNDDFRVLQLPTGKEDYWKSYEWGMFGSSFLNFMLDHPLIDKTFEPASQENFALDNKIDVVLQNFQLIQDPKKRKERASLFIDLLQETGVKYLIYDHTVSSTLYPRGILLWQRFNGPDSEAMMKEIVDDGFAKVVKNYNLDLTDYAKNYSQFSKLTDADKKTLEKGKNTYISLIEIDNPSQEISFLDKTTNLDSNINYVNSDLFSSSLHVIQQADSKSFVTYPFSIKNANLNSQGNLFTFLTSVPFNQAQMKISGEKVSLDSSNHFIDVYVNEAKGMLNLSFFLEIAPGINGSEPSAVFLTDYQIPLNQLGSQNKESNLSNYISDWKILNEKDLGPLRVRIGDYVIPLPKDISSSSKKIGTVAVQGSKVPLEILAFDKEVIVNSNDIVITQNPNCFRDKLKDPNFKVEKKGNEIKIKNQNQSLCFVVSFDKKVFGDDTSHVEININAVGNSEDLDSRYVKIPTSKKNLTSFIVNLPKPNLLRVCAKQLNINDCYNLHQFINIDGKESVTFPMERVLSNLSNMQLLLTLKNTGYQLQNIDIKKLSIDTYETKASRDLIIPGQSDLTVNIPDVKENEIKLNIPKALSIYSFYYDPKKEGLYGFNPACADKSGYRTFRNFEGNLIAYSSNCNYEFYTNVPFTSNNFSLFDVQYNLMSGKFPRFIINDGLYNYLDSFASLNQGYPSIDGFKLFQVPESIINNPSKEVLTKKIKALKTQDAYEFIRALPELDDNGSKNVTFHQDSENEGIILVTGLNIQPLPTEWQNIQILPTTSVNTNYELPQSFSFKQILPSLWTADVTGNGKMLLKFNEAFDPQWRAYDSVLGVVLGIGNSYKSVKCDGYANCFQINERGNKTYYLFYTPERLSMLGWIITISGIIIFAFIFIRFKQSSKESALKS